MKINKDGYPEIEVYGLKIRSSEDERIEIDVKENGDFVERIYIEFNFEENGGYAHIYSHNGEVDQKMPFHSQHFKKYFSALGEKGGASKSKAKQKSSRENGRLGGRPRKQKD